MKKGLANGFSQELSSKFQNRIGFFWKGGLRVYSEPQAPRIKSGHFCVFQDH